jgi:hypothetical protein
MGVSRVISVSSEHETSADQSRLSKKSAMKTKNEEEKNVRHSLFSPLDTMAEDKEKKTGPADAKPHLYTFKEFGGIDGPYCQPVTVRENKTNFKNIHCVGLK